MGGLILSLHLVLFLFWISHVIDIFSQMILQHFIYSSWLERSLETWVQQCQNAHSAESIEMLKEVRFFLFSIFY